MVEITEGMIGHLGIELESLEGTVSELEIRGSHRKNLKIDMGRLNRPPACQISGLYKSRVEAFTQAPIERMRLHRIDNEVMIEPVPKRYKAFIVGPLEGVLHLFAMEAHENDGHVSQMAHPLVLKEYLRREFWILHNAREKVEANFEGLKQSDLPILEIRPLFLQFFLLSLRKPESLLISKKPELRDAISPKWGILLLQEAEKSEQHRIAKELWFTFFDKWVMLQHINLTSIFLGTTDPEQIARFFRTFERNYRKIYTAYTTDPEASTMPLHLEFFEDRGILDRWWNSIDGIFKVAFEAVQDSEFVGPAERIGNLYNVYRQAKERAFKHSGNFLPSFGNFSIRIFERDDGKKVISAFAPNSPYANLALEHYIDSQIAEQVVNIRRYGYGELKCPFAESVQTHCDADECKHVKKWKDRLHL